MALPKYKELDLLKNEIEIDEEIFLLQKNLFDLRMKRSANQKIQFHLFKNYKRRIAQLNFKKTSLIKISKSVKK
jgi:ribosomal protein L29